MHTKNGKKIEIERTVFELKFGFFNELYLIFHKIKRKKEKKFVETMGFEPRSPGWKERVLTITPSGNLQEQAQNLKINQSSTIFH